LRLVAVNEPVNEKWQLGTQVELTVSGQSRNVAEYESPFVVPEIVRWVSALPANDIAQMPPVKPWAVDREIVTVPPPLVESTAVPA
jgi:hypothetical protein